MVNGPQAGEKTCRNCKRFYPEKSFCRKKQQKVNPIGLCADFEMVLSDHYVESPWEKWKRQAELKAAGLKSKSGM